MKPNRPHAGRLATVAALAFLTFAAPARAQPALVFEYAVKVVCGTIPRATAETPLAVGRYYTAVNIHNPARATAVLRFKTAIAGRGQPGRVSPFETMILESDQALEFDCAQIHRQGRAEWVKGFFVIHSSHELDVVAVYTASGKGDYVATFHTERVPMRRIP